MKKQDFINAVRSNSELNVTNKLVGEVIDATFGEISNLIQGETGKFTYPGFGTFALKTRNARTGINPKTKAKIQIPASKTIGFKPSTGWKETLTKNL